MSKRKRLELLTIGDELLLGIRENGHLAYLGEIFARYGLPLSRNEVVCDDAESIGSAFSLAWERADIVITTGGLGPTSDDNTRESIAAVLGRRLVWDADIEAAIAARYAKMGRVMLDSVRKQCYRPEGADVLPNRFGTAPGIWYEGNGKILIMLPGPACELRPMVETTVMPRLKAAGLAEETDCYLQIRTMGIGESLLEEKLKPVLQEFPSLQIAFCAHQGLVDVRLSTPNGCSDGCLLRRAGKLCKQILGEDFICFGHQTLGEVVLQDLRAMGRTLAIAESCTGGLLSNAFTDIPGASKVFAGSVVCYRNDSKVQMLDVPESILQQHGAVSAETAVAMAMGAAERFSADYALSVTGFAGPGGGTEENPVGTIYLGYCSPCGAWSRKVVCPGERLAVKVRAVNSALDWMRRKLIRYKAEDFIAQVVDSDKGN